MQSYLKGKWLKEEDIKLKELCGKTAKNWKFISSQLKTRSPLQCLHRWSKVLRPGLRKGPWLPDEDSKLTEWIFKFGAKNWSQCGRYLKGRSGKQCRERWHNVINPNLKKGEWTLDEDNLISFLFKEKGSKWSEIAKCLPGRTENAVKNRFYSKKRRIKKGFSEKSVKNLKEKNSSTLAHSANLSSNKEVIEIIPKIKMEDIESNNNCNSNNSFGNNALQKTYEASKFSLLQRKLNFLEELLISTKMELNKLQLSLNLKESDEVFDAKEEEEILNLTENFTKKIKKFKYNEDGSHVYIKTNNIIIKPTQTFQ